MRKLLFLLLFLAGPAFADTETLAPDILDASLNYVAPVIGDFDDDPDDDLDTGGLYGDWDANGNTDVLLGFPTPSGNPTTGTDVQVVHIAGRKADATGSPEAVYDVLLQEGGVTRQTLATGVNWADSTTKTIITATWDAANLVTTDGSAVQIRITQTAGGTGGSRRAVEIGGIEWHVDFVVGGARRVFITN